MNTSIPELKKKAYILLRDALIEGLEVGDIATEEVQESARYVKYHLEAVESPEELLLLLNELGNKWRAYKKVFITFKNEETTAEDLRKMEALQAKLRQFTNITK